MYHNKKNTMSKILHYAKEQTQKNGQQSEIASHIHGLTHFGNCKVTSTEAADWMQVKYKPES